MLQILFLDLLDTRAVEILTRVSISEVRDKVMEN
jgi:hypothetical protein